MSISGSKALRFLWDRSSPYKLAAAGMMCATLLTLAFDLVRPFFYKDIIDSLTITSDLDLGVQSALWSLFFLALSFIGHHIFWNLGHFVLVWFESRILRDTSRVAFQHVQKLSSAFHTSNFAGSTVKKCQRGVFAMETMIDKVWFDILPVSVQVIAIAIIFSIKASSLAIVLLLGILVFFTITIYLNNRQSKLELLSVYAETKASGNFHDVVSNIHTVKVFAKEKHEEKRHFRLLEDWRQKMQKAWLFHNLISISQGSVAMLLEVALFYLSIRLFQAGRFTIGDIVFVQSYFITLIGQVWRLGWVYRDFRKAVVNADEMIELLETEPLIKNKKGAKRLKFQQGEIEFRDVSFAYGDSNDAVFHNLSVHIKPGEKIALVGPSGSGKTTFVKLLSRLADVTGGQILIDGKDIRDVTVDSLRSSVGIVPQDPALFHRPLSENIAYGNPQASTKQIVRASKLAHAHEFIKDLPEQYETHVGERGVKLSGGERQRVAIARAILENAPIIVFDEATSSLDSLSEKHIQAALDNLMKGRTTIVVAHRLSTIIHMDRILVFRKGKIVEEGSHAELIKKQGSLYGKLWEIQAQGFLPE
ncbi:MAG: ABC transporter ATP-binding protein [Candidatus Gracilibacteria bacterium]|nr:ABC transporter ATP-binding protein [Candidatus Gracilibacteria bacterium]